MRRCAAPRRAPRARACPAAAPNPSSLGVGVTHVVASQPIKRLRWASRGPSENWNEHVCFAQRQRDVFIVVVGLVAQAIQRAGVFVVHAPDNPRGHPPPARTFFEVSAVN